MAFPVLTREEVERLVSYVLLRLRRTGPDRVMASPYDTVSVATARARRMPIDIAFVRSDGWVIGSPARWKHNASRLCRGHCIATTLPPYDTAITHAMPAAENA